MVLKGSGNVSDPFDVIHNDDQASRVIRDAFAMMTGRLASYMIPTSIVPITCLPMTSQGKIDKRALQRCYHTIDRKTLVTHPEESSEKKDHDNQWTKTERSIAKIIAHLAKVLETEVERSTSIFRLGLDSISIIHLSGQIVKLGFRRLEVSQIMQNPTVASLASLIEDPQYHEDYSLILGNQLEEFRSAVIGQVLEELQLSESDVKAILPCTPLQEAMLTDKTRENTASYYNHTVFELRADSRTLKRAWNTAMERNDILRTCFCVTSHPRHAYAQVVLKEYPLPWCDITIADEGLTSSMNERIEAMPSTLKISRPPIAFTLLKSDIRELLLVTTHHSLYDGFAMDLLLEEVEMAYHGLPLPPRISFSSVLQYIEDCDMSKADSFWVATMEGFQPAQFPDLTGKSIIGKTELTGMSTVRMRSMRVLKDIESGCRQLNTSLLALSQSVWARILTVLTGEIDICFGNVVSGRTIPVPGVEEMIAPCFNTIPVRVKMPVRTTNSALMSSLQRANAEALPFQLTPLRRIMSTLKTDGQMLFDTLFILQYGRESTLEQLWEVIDDRGEMDVRIDSLDGLKLKLLTTISLRLS